MLKNMKTTRTLHHMLAATMIVGCSFLSMSQAKAQSAQATQVPEYKTPEEQAKKLTDKMKSELTLTDTQYQPVYDINLKYANKGQDLMKSTEDKKAKMEAMKSTMADKDNELKAVLTPDQYKKYEGMKKEMKSKAEKACCQDKDKK